MTNHDKRLIETAFPLAEASAASLHEKNMRHGHISTLHLWPARRPLAASRAAIAAALIADPPTDAEREKLVRKLGGRLVRKKASKAEQGGSVEAAKLVGEGGILWWGQESGPDVDWFRTLIRSTSDNRPPRVLDPFSGGGAIPLEAMRLGCEVTANDLNPVAWFILKCTLEHPSKLAGDLRPLPDFALRDRAFMEGFLKAQGLKPGARLNALLAEASGTSRAPDLLGDGDHPWMKADIGWHVRAWGQWVLTQARRTLAGRYPTYAEWTPLSRGEAFETCALRMLTPDENGDVSATALNAGIDAAALADPRTPRWVAKPTVAYLWARTVRCKHCRATVPLLKTRWLCKKEGKRVRLAMTPSAGGDGVDFAVESDVPMPNGSASARKAADVELGGGTMSRTGVKCPCCRGLMSMEDVRYEGQAKRLGSVMTAVVVDGPDGKEYRRPTDHEIAVAIVPEQDLAAAFADVPFGLPRDPLPGKEAPGIRVPLYGFRYWSELFTDRQLVTLGTLTTIARRLKDAAVEHGYPPHWADALWAYMALANDRAADFGSSLATWTLSAEKMRGTFGRFALPIVWDYAEVNPLSGVTGDYSGAVEWIGKVASHLCEAAQDKPSPTITRGSAMEVLGQFDAIITDPPYYDAIPYSDLMDFFYVWLRRCLHGMSPDVDAAFESPLGPKWSHDKQDGELIDDSSRFGGDKRASKANFENGMATVFRRCAECLTPDGIVVVVFANKNPDAWETLVGALIKAGLVVDGSLPIQTERGARNRSINSAALSSSVWLVCRKRPAGVRPGFSGQVLDQMRENIRTQMHRFWDAGIRGPDFVWAATGPALEAYSRYPVVFREEAATGAREKMPVDEFLREVRRIVVEFAVGRVLKQPETDEDGEGLDDVTTYYILHRDTFGLEEAAIGSCILYAMSCGLSDQDLADRFEILAKTGGAGSSPEPEDDEDGDDEGDEPEATVSSGSGNKVRLRRWDQRKRKTLGVEGYGGRPAPLIDRVHRLMQLWTTGDLAKVNAYIDDAKAARDPLFGQLVQALIELARRDGKPDEAVLLESISNHLQARTGIRPLPQLQLGV